MRMMACRHRLLGWAGVWWLLATPLAALAEGGEPAQPAPDRTYSLLYDVRLVPTQRSAHVRIRIGNGSAYVRSVRLRIDPKRHLNFTALGELTRQDDSVEWRPVDGVATLEYDFRIDHLRNARSYDARCAEDWALFRGDDLVPPARVRTVKGTQAAAELRLRLPEGWSAALPYRRTGNGRYQIDQPDRGFDRPIGWIVVGRIAVLREKVAGVQVAVAGPLGHGLRRLDMLALLRWTLPSLRDLVDRLPERVLMVGAGDPMWRGGLSGPNSIFLHADRPLITPDGTSPLLHELMHAVLRARSEGEGDWVVEGLAEFYSLELLRRSHTISRRRYQKVQQRQEQKGAGANLLVAGEVGSPAVARAVTVLRALDAEIRETSEDARSLDDVLRELVTTRTPLDAASFRAAAERVYGGSLRGFFRRHVGADATP